MPRIQRLALPAVLLATVIAGCGSDNNDSAKTPASRPAATGPATSPATTPAPPAATAAGNGAITVDSSEFKFEPSDITAKAGKLEITLNNTGQMEHELVVLKTDQAADALKVTSGRVSEADSVGEISETAAGATKSHSFDLKPGKYVFVCNIPGHYTGGMRGIITVS